LSAGLRLNLNRLNYFNRIYHSNFEAGGWSLTWALGLHYNVPGKIQMGIFYEKGPAFNEKIESENDGSVLVLPDSIDIIDNNTGIYALFDADYRLKDKLPDRVHMGLLYRFSKVLDMTVEVASIYWHRLSDQSLNSMDISGSLVGHLSERLSLSTGALYTSRKYETKGDIYSTINDNLNALFILAGGNLRFGSLDFDIALATAISHGEWRKQNIGKISMGYYLQ
jgi:hypothetical protein